jgi:DNA-directed RNA polymerase subunit F
MKIKGSKPVTLSKVREILSERGEEGELGYEQSQALEHAEKYWKCDSKKIQKLLGNITKDGKLSEDIALKVIDVMPKDPATLKAILAKDKVEMSDEELASVIKELS